jgi:hypothetical protein
VARTPSIAVIATTMEALFAVMAVSSLADALAVTIWQNAPAAIRGSREPIRSSDGRVAEDFLVVSGVDADKTARHHSSTSWEAVAVVHPG